MNIPFALRRPRLLVRGARTDRERPDLNRLAAIDDPMDFVWAILPHAARTFATSILMLPAPKARTAAVAYLYCRMLDTYEDLSDVANREADLAGFAARMTSLDPPPPTPTAARDDRDRIHLLLVDRCQLVDRAFATLPKQDRRGIIALVESMAGGMIWSTQRFAEQGGVLVGPEQLSRYCHNVIGEPALFAVELVMEAGIEAAQRRDALAASELIQLANITRDGERDLERGIGYQSSLLPHLGSTGTPGPVRDARRNLMAHTLPHASAYMRLAEQLSTGSFSLARASAVLMLLYTDRHYRWCARRIGHPSWQGPDRTGSIIATSLLAAFSRRWSHRVMQRVEHRFLTAAQAIA